MKNGYLTGLFGGAVWGLSGVVDTSIAVAPFTCGVSLKAAPSAVTPRGGE